MRANRDACPKKGYPPRLARFNQVSPADLVAARVFERGESVANAASRHLASGQLATDDRWSQRNGAKALDCYGL